ncbi:MAG: hypothetical protein DRP86_05275 [Candidatus Neomarinimicrobiota bacterium]|nr:MAG: hypothetical protein DRP86_05275 [Candidatus Neomarinimicrobiota bacterium]
MKLRVVSSEEAGLIDRYTMGTEGVDGKVLMKKAGMSVADAVFEICQTQRISRCQIFCGKGNNGGDGAVAARELHLKGMTVDVFMTAEPDTYVGDAAWHIKNMLQSGIKPLVVKDADILKNRLFSDSVWVDALLGTGLRNTVRGLNLSILKILTDKHRNQPVVAVDLPSGLDGTNGHPLGPVLRADKTVTMGFYKAGLFLNEGKFLSGDILLTDLGYSEKALQQAAPTFLCTDAVIRSLMLPVRGTDHKYSRGQAVCIGGHGEMPGAITLAVLSAIRAGAGMVRALIPKGVSQVIYSHAPEILCHTGHNDHLSPEDIHLWHTLKKRTKAVLIGPGLGRHEETKHFVKQILRELDIPAVLDADAISSVNSGEINHTAVPLILTPHAGEFLGLTSIPEKQLQSDPVSTLRETVKKTGKIIHLKGSTSMTGFPDGQIYIHPFNSPGMATAGSGDVLGGIITSLLAQGLSPEAATLCGAHFHGLAGIKAAETMGCRGMIAGDLIQSLPKVMKEYEFIK